ncbi:MAG: M56 family metallopeptidase, partial [Candidatus Latescibacterota bacterium]
MLLPLGENEAAMASREVFLHELAHLARRDHLWLLISQIGKILFPLQPLMWALTRLMEDTNDLACDDYVLRHAAGSRDYAARLFDLARGIRPGGLGTATGTGIISFKSPLRKRIEHILDNTYARHISPSAGEIMSFALLFLCTVTLTGFVGLQYKISDAAVTRAPARERHSDLEGAPVQLGVLTARKLSPAPVASGIEQPVAISPVEESTPIASAEHFSPSLDIEPKTNDPVLLADAGITRLDTELLPAPSGNEMVDRMTADDMKLSNAKNNPPFTEVKQAASSEKHPTYTSHSADSTRKETLAPFGSVALAQMSDFRNPETSPGKFQIKAVSPSKDFLVSEEMCAYLKRGQTNPVWSPDGKLIAFT